jgi:hypothetical protein
MLKVEIGLKTGKKIQIKDIPDFKDFREFANKILEVNGFSIFGGSAVNMSEIEYVEELK